MQAPHFIALDGNHFDDDATPVAIAWSTSDGLIKTTLIQPDDNWQGLDYAVADMHGIQEDTLYQLGETCWSVLRELELDIEQGQLLIDPTTNVHALLEALYQACDRELNLELFDIEQQYPGLFSDRQAELHHLPCDERIRLLVLEWHQNYSVTNDISE